MVSQSLRFKPFITICICLVITCLEGLGQKNLNKQIPSTEVKAEIDLTNPQPPIEDLMYGHFIENLSNWFEGGLWSEMIGDRKFFYPITNADTLIPQNRRSGILGRWRPVGPENAVVPEYQNSYVGDHTPRIKVDPSQARGIRQGDLPLVAGRKYDGRVVLTTDASETSQPGSQVLITLIWGPGSKDRQSIEIPELKATYQKYDFSFVPGTTTDQGQIEITGTGSGSFLIGAVSLMPADNTSGFRTDLIELLREMRVTMLRLGGNFSSGYEWRDGIGDRDQRPPRYDYAWKVVEQNDVGTFEFLELCRLVGAEPNIGVNSGFGDAWSARDWVEYVNGSLDTPMGKLRASHGHEEPFRVKWWGIGNEMYGEWQLGHMSLEHYVIKHNMFAKRMREVDPDIILVASGATPFEMNTVLRHFHDLEEIKMIPKRPIEYGSLFDWTGGLLEHSGEYMDYVAEHMYPLPGHIFDEDQQKFVEVDEPLINEIRRPANRIKGAKEAWEIYEQRFPWLRNSDIKMVWDEWVSGKRGHHGTLGTATVLNELFRHTDLVKMSAYTCAPCALTYTGTQSGFRGIGLVFKLYANHFETIPVPVNGDQPQKEIPGTLGVDKPAETSGSPTYPLDIAASISEDNKSLTVAVVNPTYSEQELHLELKGGNLGGEAVHWYITGPDVEARNEAGKGFPITLQNSTINKIDDPLVIAPITVNLYQINLD